MDYRYFKITGGKVKEAFERFTAKFKDRNDARQAFKRKHKSDGVYANDFSVSGLVFKDTAKVPAGWKAVRGEPTVFRPHGAAKAMRELRGEMALLRAATVRDFQNEVFNDKNLHDFAFMEGLRCHFMYPEEIGNHLILCVPKTKGGEFDLEKRKWSPPDKFCVEIKTSEYWKLKEKAQK